MTLDFRIVKLMAAAVLLWALCGASCHIREDDSAYAATAGQATMALGGCLRPLTTGWESCLVEKGQPLPQLRMVFTNPAEWMIGDCTSGGVFKTGSQAAAGEVVVDLSPMFDEIQAKRVCILDIEAIESYPDPTDKKITRKIPLIGGFYVQVIDPGYMPIPAPNLDAWCYTVKRTTKGRTVVEACK